MKRGALKTRYLRSGYRFVLVGLCVVVVGLALPIGILAGQPQAAEGDAATHQADHAEDAADVVLPDVHVHGLPLNKDQQLGPVPTYMPWPTIPSSLDGQELDDWMKARFLVSKEARVSVVVLEPCKHRELTGAGLTALNQWKFDPQLKGDEPVDGEITVRIHFRTR